MSRLFVLLIAISMFSLTVFNASTKDMVVIGEVRIPVLIAETNEELRRGLSGMASLDKGAGMLFIFPKADTYTFWMPNMNFPIDIIWINDGVVVDIHHNVSNEFDLDNPKIYTPKEPAQYILEVNAGIAEEHNIKIGDSVIISLSTNKIFP